MEKAMPVIKPCFVTVHWANRLVPFYFRTVLKHILSPPVKSPQLDCLFHGSKVLCQDEQRKQELRVGERRKNRMWVTGRELSKLECPLLTFYPRSTA